MPCTEQILELDSSTPPDKVDPRYRKGVGQLLWLVVISRFDLAYTVSLLGRFNSCGGVRHMEALLQAIRYAYATRHYKVKYGRGRSNALLRKIVENSEMRSEALSDQVMIMFTDASQGGEKPMAGFCAWFGGGLLHWSGYRLTMTTLSSTEGEYVAATKAAIAAIALRGVLGFLQAKDSAPTITFCDNLGAVLLSDNNTSSKRLKHIATRIAFLREAIADGHLQLHHIRTTGQLADIFTKPLAPTLFHSLRQLAIG